jgi:hypothetical protein
LHETEQSVAVSWRHNGQAVDHFDIYKSANAGPMTYLARKMGCSPICTYSDLSAPGGDGDSAAYQVDAIGPGATRAGANPRGGAPAGPTVSLTGLSAPTRLIAWFSCPNSPCFTWADNSNQEDGYRVYVQEKDGNGNLLSTYMLLANLPANTTNTDATTVPCPVCQNESPRNRRLKVVAIRNAPGGVVEESAGAAGVLQDLH